MWSPLTCEESGEGGEAWRSSGGSAPRNFNCGKVTEINRSNSEIVRLNKIREIYLINSSRAFCDDVNNMTAWSSADYRSYALAIKPPFILLL